MYHKAALAKRVADDPSNVASNRLKWKWDKRTTFGLDGWAYSGRDFMTLRRKIRMPPPRTA